MKFKRKRAEGRLGGEVYALAEMAGHVAFYEPLEGLPPGMIGFEDRESLFTYSETYEAISEKNLVWHLLSSQLSVEQGGVDSIHGFSGMENPADGPIEVGSDMVLGVG